MAQMTVAVALGAESARSLAHHLDDTLEAGRGLCDEALARLLCEEGADAHPRDGRMACRLGAAKDGHITQAIAPGHDRPRCVYVDFLNTGPAVSTTLRRRSARSPAIRRVGDLCVTDLVSAAAMSSAPPRCICRRRAGHDRRQGHRSSPPAASPASTGATAPRPIWAATAMRWRCAPAPSWSTWSSCSSFPIGHLAPRLIGMDPIMWDPFRYKLGGRLLNGDGEEFPGDYGVRRGRQVRRPRATSRTYAIVKEVEAGRGSPARRRLSELPARAGSATARGLRPGDRPAGEERHRSRRRCRSRWRRSRITTWAASRWTTRWRPTVPGLFAAGEAVGGANGANRLSGNAITEALVFGARAGRQRCARRARAIQRRGAAAQCRRSARLARRRRAGADLNTAALIAEIARRMKDDVGPLRTEQSSARAGSDRRHARTIGALPPAPPLAASTCAGSNGLTCATCCSSRARWRPRRWRARKAAAAHQREDFPQSSTALAGQPVRHPARQATSRCRAMTRASRRARGRHERARCATVWRGTAAAGGRWESYEVPFEPGQSVLDGLRWIRTNATRASPSASPASTPMPARNA